MHRPRFPYLSLGSGPIKGNPRLVLRVSLSPARTQWARTEPLLPTDSRGKNRGGDRRVLSETVHALKNGGRWAERPLEVYGPKKTLYNRFVRWATAISGKGYSARWRALKTRPTGCSSNPPASRFIVVRATENLHPHIVTSGVTIRMIWL